MNQNKSTQNFSLNALFKIIQERKENPSPSSYTSRLLTSGQDEIVKKIGEESIEVILAAVGQSESRLVEEVADLTYHVLVLLCARGIYPDRVLEELASRHTTQ